MRRLIRIVCLKIPPTARNGDGNKTPMVNGIGKPIPLLSINRCRQPPEILRALCFLLLKFFYVSHNPQ
jgi:hypothetical protein